MAVEARHHNLFPYREMMSAIEGNNGNIYNGATPMGYGVPLSGTTGESLLPLYSSVIVDSVPAKTPMKSDSDLTYNLPVSGKRSRDDHSNSITHPSMSSFIPNAHHHHHNLSLLGQDMSFQIQQHHYEIDRFIAQHTEKVRLEIEERRKRQSRRMIAAVEEGIAKRLRAKEEEIEKIGKLNWALEERVKSLCFENQILRELAQTNEATANALRTNLEQVLAAAADRHHGGTAAGLDDEEVRDDAESCCGSNHDGDEDEGRCTLASSGGGEREWVKDKKGNYKGTNSSSNNSSRQCRNCGKEESCVLLLPCRHLCLCTVCGSTLHTCPVCKSNKTASVHVNMSS